MRGDEVKWTKVQYRKKKNNDADFHGAISYYVAGMPTGVKKVDIRRSFEGFGDLVDIFMGKKKDAAGMNFAFVKFNNVEDIWKLESVMQNVICAGKPVSVNVARYGCDKSPIYDPNAAGSKPPALRTSRQPQRPFLPHRTRTVTTGNRSYADVTSGLPTKPTPPLPTPIPLNPCNSPKNWLTNKVLVGEALSIDHMASLHSIKYIGGLNVALCFKDQQNAVNYMKDSSRWIEWLQWVVPGDSRDFCDDRIAWINIIGLPMRLWSDENIHSITKSLGRMIVPSDEMGANTDESILQMGILTKSRNWINTEMAVTVGGLHFNIGVVEFDRNWTPLSDNTFIDTDSSLSKGNEDEEDGISDTDMALEDGEILPESEEY
ncbi:hypothetical protein LXL04_016558 [Taraxacum kok-saghyz]